MATRAMVIRTVEDVERAIPGIVELLATVMDNELRERLVNALLPITAPDRADLAERALRQARRAA